SNNSITMNVAGGTVSNDGTITTSATGNALTIQSTGTTLTTAGLTIAGSGTLNLSAGGALRFMAQDINNGAVTFNNGITQTVQGGGNILFSTPKLILGSGTPISAQGASNITMDSGTGNVGLAITAPATSTTVSTTGGSFQITPTSGYDVAI